MSYTVLENLMFAGCILTTTFAANLCIRSLFLASIAASVAATALMHLFFVWYFGRLNELAPFTIPSVAIIAFIFAVPVGLVIRHIRAFR
jgi:hypothetical protein